ncbi:hypothetical protein [Bradyrhizobium genosp. P]|uniref:hypothetical protein n=1 Tax=Bradyrhizobium genosp. P TaxID=83641 RepID=UPI003CF61AC8
MVWFGRIAIVNAVRYSAKRLGTTHDPELHSLGVDGAQALRDANGAALHKKTSGDEQSFGVRIQSSRHDSGMKCPDAVQDIQHASSSDLRDLFGRIRVWLCDARAALASTPCALSDVRALHDQIIG